MAQREQPETLGNGRFTIQRRIGAGGEGAVFLAYDGTLSRWVAIKRIHSSLSQGQSTLAAAAIREATHLASLQHPNIITVHDIINSSDETLVVMEYMPGQNVDELAEPMSAPFFIEFASQCLRGLIAAHSLGIVHRDVKPSNIMLAGQHIGGFQVKLLDFGLAKVIEEPMLQTVDQMGALTGSIFMMSPEQLEGQPIDHRTDIYSLGCVFYKALTRQHPFQGKSVPAVVASHLSHAYDPLESLRPDLPPPLIAWVENLFARDRADRPPTAAVALEWLPSSEQRVEPPSIRKTTPAANPSTVSPVSKKPKNRILLLALSIIPIAGATIWLLGDFDEGRSTPKLLAESVADSEQRTLFEWSDRKEVSRRQGKKITIIGTIAGSREDKNGRFHLIFKGASSSDPSLCFDREKGDFSMLLLKKLVGLDVQATGIVGKDASLLYLDNPTIREFVISKPSPTPKN